MSVVDVQSRSGPRCEREREVGGKRGALNTLGCLTGEPARSLEGFVILSRHSLGYQTLNCIWRPA